MKSPQGKPGWKTPQPAQRCSGHRGTSKETPLWDPWTARLGYPGVEYNTVRLVDRRTPPVFAAVSTEVRWFRMGLDDLETIGDTAVHTHTHFLEDIDIL